MKFMMTSLSITTMRRFWLVLPALAITIVSCDNSHSSSTSNNAVSSKVSAFINAQDDGDDVAVITNSNDESEFDYETDSVEVVEEGQSLIAAAKPDEAQSSLPSSNTLQATLMGDYGGIIPCTFCDYIEVTLNLFADGSVVKTSVYNNPKLARVPLVESGIYRQDDDKITIAYDNQHTESYHIEDNHLLMIDKNKNIDVNHALSRQ
ncbi:copper resistance protein NlpE N-terminal domain-containing protein [uncultured Psychrobacter sp.]|uniref:copper resistance protein NlpE N-terminal domain-containing protein n=1 Tax=unclassified Psychrobacter TaxID=196806 RepID=UPI00293D1F08|nr:copper resistance protein NlpE N-terminal domain-containing protein [uncultured Psychrobacter sp.]